MLPVFAKDVSHKFLASLSSVLGVPATFVAQAQLAESAIPDTTVLLAPPTLKLVN